MDTDSEKKQEVIEILDNDSNTDNNTNDTPKIGENKYAPQLPNSRTEWRVEFDKCNDPLNPKNWSMFKKLTTSLILGYAAVVCGCGSSIFSAATEVVANEYDKSIELANLGTSLFIAGFASGPVIWGPASELYGRKVPMLLATFGGALFNTVTGASTTFPQIMIFRFLAGFISAAPVSVSGGAFSDMFEIRQRGTAMVIFTSSIFSIPILAPIVGAALVQHTTWRWIQYLMGMMGFLAFLLLFFFLPESYVPVILTKKARDLRESSGNWGIHHPHENIKINIKTIFSRTVAKPVRMLTYEPILLLVSIYTAFVYGMFYLSLISYPVVFHTGYKMSRFVSTLPYIAQSIGMIFGTLLILFVFEPRYRSLKVLKPRDRLPPAIIGGFMYSIGMFYFAWGGNYPDKIHWMVPTSSGLCTGAGTILILISCTNYVVDSYVPVTSSALAANSSLRAFLGAASPLFACRMFQSMGVGAAGSIIGGISVLLLPVPVVFYKFDDYFRSKSQYTL